ncbi:MAG: thymidylate synthase [Candidatus Woesearchaeota archaeon]
MKDFKVIKIGEDPYLKKDINKIIFKEPPQTQLFTASDVIMGNPSSNIAVAFVYTWKDDEPPQNIKEFMQNLSNYAYLTGLWKTTNGARYVFSNLLANPNVNKLFLLVFGQKDNGHLLVDALENFWKNGTNTAGIIIGSKAQNPKFEQLPREALERIRQQCDLVIVRNIREFPEVEKLIRLSVDEPSRGANLADFSQNIEFLSLSIKNNLLYDDGARFNNPMLVDLAKSAGDVSFAKKHYSETLGQSIQAKNLDDALHSIAAFVFSHGSHLPDERNIHLVECRSFTITIMDPLEKIPEGFSQQYINDYIDEFMHGLKHKEDLEYTYHDRIFVKWGNQPERVIKMLTRSPTANRSRRMVISLWDPASDLENPCAPCLDFIWVVVRDGKLEFHVVFRSQHLATITENGKLMQGEGAFVPNIFGIATLQEFMARQLKLERGPLVLTDFSGHLYMSGIK